MTTKRAAVAHAHAEGVLGVKQSEAIRAAAERREAQVRAQLPESYTVSQWFRDIREQNHISARLEALFRGGRA